MFAIDNVLYFTHVSIYIVLHLCLIGWLFFNSVSSSIHLLGMYYNPPISIVLPYHKSHLKLYLGPGVELSVVNMLTYYKWGSGILYILLTML